MRKFFATLLALIILAGLGAFFGWAQLGVPPDAYGIIRSKTHGIDPRLVIPGEFRWVWYKLIPTNVVTSVFHIKPVHHEFSARNILPSGAVYRSFAGIDGDFNWEINATFSFSLRPEALIALVTRQNIGTQEELAYYEQEMAGQIEAFILRHMSLGEALANSMEDLLLEGENPDLEREILRQFPLITHFSIRIKSAIFPDFDLYRQTKALYEHYIVLQREYMVQDLGETAKNRMESQFLFNELEQYGALLTKYPVLLEYLALESIGKKE